ncbi:MAG TPA: potassium channel family protein [Verrucomicrobiae bacterium]|nr:potassium channel family protein [Verrucomicrobiae bacterium]
MDKTARFRLRAHIAIFVAVMTLGTAGVMHLENLSLLDAVYFCTVTVATVGYGDIHPVTPWGKILAMVLIVTGVGTFLSVIASFTEVLLTRREQHHRATKLHMIIGLFFSEIGTRLLHTFAAADQELGEVRSHLLVDAAWSQRDYTAAATVLKKHRFAVNSRAIDLRELREILQGNGNFVARLLENPYVIDHETFSDVLIALLHLKEELESREVFDRLPLPDIEHLGGDIRRVYTSLALQWLGYLQHLQGTYPFLFSLAVRRNPFDEKASVVITD